MLLGHPPFGERARLAAALRGGHGQDVWVREANLDESPADIGAEASAHRVERLVLAAWMPDGFPACARDAARILAAATGLRDVAAVAASPGALALAAAGPSAWDDARGVVQADLAAPEADAAGRPAWALRLRTLLGHPALGPAALVVGAPAMLDDFAHTCATRARDLRLPHRALGLEVPCALAASPVMLVRALGEGARAVLVVPCEADCPTCHGSAPVLTIRRTHSLLRRAGRATAAVATLAPAEGVARWADLAARLAAWNAPPSTSPDAARRPPTCRPFHPPASA